MFMHNEFDAGRIPGKQRKLLKNVLIQLARNAVVHGIEPPEERRQAGKNRRGKIEMVVAYGDDTISGGLELRFGDDGRGLQIEKLRETAVNSGRWTLDDVSTWSNQHLAKMIFLNGNFHS